jgi:hypothetical protein
VAETPFVGAAEGCDLLILKNQKIAAFGSSYIEIKFHAGCLASGAFGHANLM